MKVEDSIRPRSSCGLAAAGVLFDLDGVLVDSTTTVEQHWRALARRHELDADRLLEGLHGKRMIDIMTAALPHLKGDALRDEASRFEMAEAAGADMTIALPGAVELTAQLRGLPWAVVTSGTMPVARARMSAVGLVEPPVLVTGEQVSAGKPSPEPYLRAAELLGVPPQRCVVVEDAPTGISAGHAAGCTTVAVTTSHGAAELARADHIISTPRDIRLVRALDGVLELHVRCERTGHLRSAST